MFSCAMDMLIDLIELSGVFIVLILVLNLCAGLLWGDK